MEHKQLQKQIAQMLLLGFQGASIQEGDPIAQAILSQFIGGVVLFDYNFQTKSYDNNIQNPEQLKKLTNDLQTFATQATHLPLFISIDYEGGKVNRLKESYGFPKTISPQEVGQYDLSQAAAYAKSMSEVLKQNGINVNFFPNLDVNINAENPIIGGLGRSFSADAYKIIQYAALFAEENAKRNIVSVYKHFPGHGSSTSDSHLGFVDVTNTWSESELIPYKALLNKSSKSMTMTSHVVHYGMDPMGFPASLSKAMTQNLLRNQLGFNGIVITDDLQMRAITDKYGFAESLKLAINAGADILTIGNQLALAPTPAEINEIILKYVIDKEIPLTRIQESYQRITTLKKSIAT